MDIKAKITKLLEKANSTTHAAEAETLMAKARALMEEHQVSEYELGGDPFEAKRGTEFQKGTQAQLRYDLQASLAEYLGMKVAILTFNRQAGQRLPKAVYEFVGTESAQITLDYLFPFVWGQILKMVNAEATRSMAALNATLSQPLKAGADYDAIWKKAYRKLLKDTVVSMQVRLDELCQVNVAKPSDGSASANALVKIGGELDAFYQDRYPNLQEGKTKLVDPLDAARRLASQVRLDTQMAATTDPARLLK